MTLFSIMLFIHILGVVSLFGGIIVLQQAGARLRTATTWPEARPWLSMLRSTRGMFGSGSGMLLVTGLYMTHAQWTFATPWVSVAIATVLLLMIAGPLVTGPAFARIGRAGAGQDGPIAPAVRAQIASPALWGPATAMNGAAVAMVWLMTNKPGWTGSITIAVTLAVLGGVLGVLASRSRPPAADHSPVSGGALPQGGRRAP